MTEILTKEKQFRKLNQQLDRMAVTACGARETVAPKTDNRYYTYQKSKGPSTLLRKTQVGAGDGMAEIVDVANIRQTGAMSATVNKLGMGGETYRLANRPPPTASFQGQSTLGSNLPQYRPKQKKCNDSNRSQTYNRAISCRAVPSNNSNFTIQYHNTKFVESPSLEMLVKEESSALRCETEALRVGSLNSIAIDDSISTGRCSQASNHTIASKRNISSEGLIKFLKSKIVILEEDHGLISQEMTNQKELLVKTLEHTKTLQQQRDQTITKNNSLTEQLAKTEKQLEEANNRLKEYSIEQNAQHKELEVAKRDLKILTQTKSNLEKRLFRANEDLDSVRNTLSLMKTNDREQKETTRKECDNKESQIKSLKKQRANLLNAYKKQLFLIDNLKRQNILLEQAKMLDFGEKEFAKVLDWDTKS